jgi:hypothetical protein
MADIIQKLNTPGKIQEYLNTLKYSHSDRINSPLKVIKNKKAQCLESALLAAACLKRAGNKPLIVDLRAVCDDDHVIAVYREDGLWGAISKSSFSTLQYREPVYRSVRELAMSYFDMYFSRSGRKSLREYSMPLNLNRFDKRDWIGTDEDLSYIGEYLDGIRHYRLISTNKVGALQRVEKTLLKAGQMQPGG